MCAGCVQTGNTGKSSGSGEEEREKINVSAVAGGETGEREKNRGDNGRQQGTRAGC